MGRVRIHWRVVGVLLLSAVSLSVSTAGQKDTSYPAWLTGRFDHQWYRSRKADLSPQMQLIRKVYLGGSYLKAIHWASRYLPKKTCLQVVTNPNRADALLMLDPAENATKEAVDKMYEYSCSSTPLSVSCSGPDGKVWTTRCVSSRGGDVYCTSGEDPLLEAAGNALDKIPFLNPSVSSFRATFITRDGKVLGTFFEMDSWGASYDFKKACGCKKR